MTQLLDGDLHFVMSRVPKDVRAAVKEHGLFIAGGFIRSIIAGERISDIDLFGATKEKLDLCAMKMAAQRSGRSHETDNAITVLSPPRYPVQFVHRWLYPSGADGAERLLKEFDFTIAQAVIWWETNQWHSVIADNYYADLAARRLVYTFPKREEDAGGFMLRVRKFLERGYHIQASSLGGVIARIAMAVRWNAVEDENKAALVITGLLREVDPLTIVDGIEIVNEHEPAE